MNLISCPPLTASICHACETIVELRAYTAFADEYRKAALTESSHPEYREAGLMALYELAQAEGQIPFHTCAIRSCQLGGGPQAQAAAPHHLNESGTPRPPGHSCR